MYSEFCFRHAREVTLRKPDNLDRGRTRMANQHVMTKYFEVLKGVLDDYGLRNKAMNIFNADESGISMEARAGKVVIARGSKHAYSESKGPRDHITVNVCCSASGQLLPPMIIFEKCWPSGSYAKNGPIGTLYAKSPNGYMDAELFILWFKKIFVPYTMNFRPALLILDGHGSHITYELTQLATENDIQILLLPPHTTNILQPLDVSFFRPLKTHLSRITDGTKLLSLTGKYASVNKTNVSAVFKEAYERVAPATVINGFRKCGICPFNPDAIDKSRLMPTLPLPEESILPTATTADAEISLTEEPSVTSTPVQEATNKNRANTNFSN